MDNKTCSLVFHDKERGEANLIISGHLVLENLKTLEKELKQIFAGRLPSELIVDAAPIDYMDSAGALFLIDIEEKAKEHSMPFRIVNLSTKNKGLVDLIDREALSTPALITEKKSLDLITHAGEATFRMQSDLVQSITFFGDLIEELIHTITHPHSVRWRDVIVYMRKVGVEGLPIVSLISFLLGLIIAFMSSLQLRQFGANTFIPSLVSIAMVRELGPIMTAIIVAGRSGSAFAAEIGTMKVNEEVDALITMGFNPTRFLTIPKVLAAVAVIPLLTLFADLSAITGGLIVGVVGLDLTIYTYLTETVHALDVFNVVASMVKSLVFAFAIAAIGCQRGLRVRGGAEAVGGAATSAVVTALFLIIVIDSIFAIVLNYIR